MKYKAYLFDLDDTLLDFHSAEKEAFTLTLNEFGVRNNIEEAYTMYKSENLKLWKLHEEGKVDRASIRFDRFDKVIRHYNWDMGPQYY